MPSRIRNWWAKKQAHPTLSRGLPPTPDSEQEQRQRQSLAPKQHQTRTRRNPFQPIRHQILPIFLPTSSHAAGLAVKLQMNLILLQSQQPRCSGGCLKP